MTTVEWKNGDEKTRPSGSRAGPSACDARAKSAAVVQVDHPRPDDRDCVAPTDAREHVLEPRREGDVVGVHPRDVRPARVLERHVERAGEPERRLVPDDAHTRVVDRREPVARPVDRAVVDDDQLEVGAVWPSTLRTASSIVAAAFRAARITETRGGGATAG